MSQRVIIFDSPDGTGKTEIAKALSTKQGIPYFRMPTQHENWRTGKFLDALRFDQTYISQFLQQTGYDVIIDRAYPSEFVYSKVFGRETDQTVLRQVDMVFASMNARIIVPVRHDYSSNRKDELVDKSYLPKLHDAYMEFCEWTRCSTVIIYVDSYYNKLEKELEAIQEALNVQLSSSRSKITLDKR